MEKFERSNQSLIYKDTDGNRKSAQVVIPVSQNGSPLSLVGLASLEYRQISVSDVKVEVIDEVPKGTQMALIKIENAGVRYRDDGQDPTPVMGMPLDDGESMVYDASMQSLRFIAMSSASVINITFYGDDDAGD